MDSMPPATMISLVPEARRSCANIAAFIPEPHILFTVVQPAASGRPAPSEAWRAGAWPCPADSTQPMITSSTSSGEILARSTAARIAAAPSSGAAKPFSSPWKAPIGVLAAETMTIGSGCMHFSFQKLLDRLNGFGFQPGDQLGGGQGARQRRSLACPHGDEIRLASLGGSLAELAGDGALCRERELRLVFHLAHETVGEAARGLAREFFRYLRLVFPHAEKRLLVNLRGAAFGTRDERGAELRGLRAKRQDRRNPGSVHDAARGDDRQLHRAHDQARQRERAGERLVGIAQIAAAMPAGLAALRDDEVEAERFESLGLCRRRRAGSQEDSQSLQFFNFDGGKRAEVDGKDPRPDLFDGGDLLLQLWRIRRGDRLRWRQSALGVIAGHGGERRALRRRLDRLRLRRDEQVDAERPVGLVAHPRGLPLHLRGLRVGEAKGAQSTGRRAGGNEFLRGGPAGHRRLDNRVSQTQSFTEGG